MRIVHRYLTWDSHTKIIKPLRQILEEYNIAYKYKDDPNPGIQSFKYSIEFFLYENNPNFTKAKKEIDKFGIEPQTGTVYEKIDIAQAEWFQVSTGEYQYPQPEEDEGYLKATFNLNNYCPLCSIGKIQNAPFRLKTTPKQPNNQFWGLHWEFAAIFVRQRTKDILEREKIKGIRFSSPVLHKKNTPIEGFYQLQIDTILKKGCDYYNTNTITCKHNNEENLNTDSALDYCGKIKFHHPKIGGYLFDKSIFDSDFDIVESNEFFGSGGLANRLQIVSKKFKGIVEKNKLKGLTFIPIMHERLTRQLGNF